MTILLRTAGIAAGVLMALCGGVVPEAGEASASGRLDDLVRSHMTEADVPGVAYAVVGPEGIRHLGTFGVDGDGAPVTGATPFLWGSLAKPATATLVMSLAATGDLGLDDRVVDHLPEFRMADPTVSDRITVRHLLAQTSGIPTSVAYTDRFDPGRRPADVLPALAQVRPVSVPGTEHHYSSGNYLLLSAVVEAATGRPFAETMTQRVLRPTGMDGAIVDAQRAADVLPPGHRYVVGRPVPFDTPYDPAGTGYGYLGGTLADAAAFARANLGGGPGAIPARTREAMYRAEATTGPGQGYGLGWRRWPLEDTGATVVWHGGAAAGYQAMTVLLPHRDTAVVVLQNAYGPFQESHLLGTTFGLATLIDGGTPTGTGAGTGPAYAVALAVLVACVAALLGLLGRAVVLLVRPPGQAPAARTLRASAGWVAGLGVVLWLVGVVLPDSLGVGLTQTTLWVPDLAWSAWTILVTAAVLLLLRIVLAVRALRGRSWKTAGARG